MTYLSLIVLIPLAGLFWRSASGGLDEFIRISTDPRTLAALRLSFTTSFVAALVNLVFGMILAWILVRYEFPGRRLIDAVIDLPFALPTAVAGIALTTLYAPNGWIGAWLAPLGIRIAYSQTGIIIALIFIGLPFVVRSVQPVLEDLNREVEEVAATLGANRRQTVRRVVMPALWPGAADRLRARLRPRGRRIRLGDLHRRQQPLQDRDRAAADRHQAGGILLLRRDDDRRADADRIIPGPACDQPDPELEPAEIWRCLTKPSPPPALPGASAIRFRPVTMERKRVRVALILVSLAFLGLFLVMPVVAVFVEAFRGGMPAFAEAIFEPDAAAAIRLTLLVAAISVPCNLVFGLAASWAIAKFDFKGKSLLNTLIDLPFSSRP